MLSFMNWWILCTVETRDDWCIYIIYIYMDVWIPETSHIQLSLVIMVWWKYQYRLLRTQFVVLLKHSLAGEYLYHIGWGTVYTLVQGFPYCWDALHYLAPVYQNCQRGNFGTQRLGPWFNIKMTSYQYRKSHCVHLTTMLSPQWDFLYW